MKFSFSVLISNSFSNRSERSFSISLLLLSYSMLKSKEIHKFGLIFLYLTEWPTRKSIWCGIIAIFLQFFSQKNIRLLGKKRTSKAIKRSSLGEAPVSAKTVHLFQIRWCFSYFEVSKNICLCFYNSHGSKKHCERYRESQLIPYDFFDDNPSRGPWWKEGEL